MNKPGGNTKAAVAFTALACLAGLAPPSPAFASTDDARPLVLSVDSVFNNTGPWLDTSDRQAVIDSYAAEFGPDVPDHEWTGDHETCDVGTTSPVFRAATIDRVNWFRSAAGLPPITENPELSAMAQQAVLTSAMSPVGGLSHDPLDTYDCFTQAALEASQRSNLYKGRFGPNAITGYMIDWGGTNTTAGHRNWVLNPTAQQFGTGDAIGINGFASANVLLVVEVPTVPAAPNPVLREADGFVAWPSSGFVPAEVVFPRWSFSLRDADFSNATVTTQRFVNGVTTDVSGPVIFNDSAPGAAPQEIIVWEPALEFLEPSGKASLPTPAEDQTYRITVDGVVVGGTTESFTYDVTVIGNEVSSFAVPDHAAPTATPATTPQAAVARTPTPVVRGDAPINDVDRETEVNEILATDSPLNIGRLFVAGARMSSTDWTTADFSTGTTSGS